MSHCINKASYKPCNAVILGHIVWKIFKRDLEHQLDVIYIIFVEEWTMKKVRKIKKSKKQMHSANEPLIVIPSKAPKSIMASKSFNPVVEDLNEMNRWFSILAIELHNRIMQNLEEYNTWPKTFSVLKGSFSACLHILISSLVTLRFNTVSFISFKSDRINYKR